MKEEEQPICNVGSAIKKREVFARPAGDVFATGTPIFIMK
jgi:hypothetical protein